jgi:Uma2 family endonuclease
LKVGRDDIFYYPDVVVACRPLNFESTYLTNPRLIVEVLSPSTERIDRREKALNYRHADSLEEYVLVSQRPMQVTIYRRGADWMPEVLTSPDAEVEFRSIEMKTTLETFYDGTQ